MFVTRFIESAEGCGIVQSDERGTTTERKLRVPTSAGE